MTTSHRRSFKILSKNSILRALPLMYITLSVDHLSFLLVTYTILDADSICTNGRPIAPVPPSTRIFITTINLLSF